MLARVVGRTDRSPHVRESETIFDSGFQSLGSRFLSLELGFRIPVVDSGFLKLHSGFQSPGFQVSKAKIPLIPESKFAFMGRDRVFFSRVSLPYSDKLVSLKSNLSLLYYYRYSFSSGILSRKVGQPATNCKRRFFNGFLSRNMSSITYQKSPKIRVGEVDEKRVF